MLEVALWWAHGKGVGRAVLVPKRFSGARKVKFLATDAGQDKEAEETETEPADSKKQQEERGVEGRRTRTDTRAEATRTRTGRYGFRGREEEGR